MNAEDFKPYLRSYVESITSKSKGKNMYICPLCGSGDGPHRTGAFSITPDGLQWSCFKCMKKGDTLDLLQIYENIPDKAEAIKRANELFGDGNTHYTQHTHNTQEDQPEPDFTEFFLEAQKHLGETSYHSSRGISTETANRFGLGFVSEWRHPKAPNAPTSPRLIIPTSKHSYLARDTSGLTTQYSKMKVGRMHIFNEKALNEADQPIYIVEGEIDALSIIEVGGEAIALGSTSAIPSFLLRMESQKPTQPLIIALDNDEAGKNGAEALENGLKRLEIPFYRHNPSGTYEDANEALTKNREAFKQAITEQLEVIRSEAEEQQKTEEELYKQTSTAHYLEAFQEYIYNNVNKPSISTGFRELDSILDGGLYEGLYILGAISSLGKTTFIMQMADQIAQSGEDALIFSMEMGKEELIAKSLSRLTIQEVMQTNKDTRNAKTVRGILAGSRWPNYSREELTLIWTAMEKYKKYADHIYIKEGVGDIGAKEIREAVKRHTELTGKAPVVIVDYLQILAPYSERTSDKQNTDKAVLELKRMSRDYKTPVIAISSFNRENYSAEVSMRAFKESGAIEYGCDILMGLQLKGAGTDSFDEQTAKAKNPREVELKILKNRNGTTGATVEYRYYPMFNYFEEVQSWEL